MTDMSCFSLHELYYLIDSFGGDTLIGLPSLSDLPIPEDDIWETTQDSLVTKGILTSEGDLTSDGFVVVEVLRAYCTGQSLTVINNCYIMFTGEGRVSVMIVDTSEGYQLLRLGAVSLLAFIQEKLPLTLREPLADEKTFLTSPLALNERIEVALVADDSLVIQHYPLSDMVVSQYRQELYSSWLFQEIGNELIGFNVSNQEAFRFSQYYFLERLYTWLGIPFREEEFE